jgi:thiosulfate dehydrogenase [quinone] large subunit
MQSRASALDIVHECTAVFLRLALGITFLAAVTDRFGLWGSPGSPNVAWGDLDRFAAYAATLNPWAPAALISLIVWIVTLTETCLGTALIVGLWTRWSALCSGVLLLLFALGMTVGTGVKSALNASVFSASAAAFALSNWGVSVWSIDALRLRRCHERSGS